MEQNTDKQEGYIQNSKSTDLIKPTRASDTTLDNLNHGLFRFITFSEHFIYFFISVEFRVYKRRWIVLAIFVLYSASNALQWIQYSIIANIIQR